MWTSASHETSRQIATDGRSQETKEKLAAGPLAGSASNSPSQWDGRIRGKADGIMESVLAWADCASDLNTSIGVTAAFQPSEQQVGEPHVNCLCIFSRHILTIKEKAVHTCATLSKEYMKYSVKDLEGWETHCEFFHDLAEFL